MLKTCSKLTNYNKTHLKLLIFNCIKVDIIFSYYDLLHYFIVFNRAVKIRKIILK